MSDRYLSREEFIEHALDVIAQSDSTRQTLEKYQALIEMGHTPRRISELLHERSEEQLRWRVRKQRKFLG